MIGKVTVDMRVLDARFAKLKKSEIPSAIRHATNDLAFDTRKRIITEMDRVFHKPTREVKRTPWVTKQKVNNQPGAVLSLTHWNDPKGRGSSKAIFPHVPGEDSIREPKGMERWLRRAGYISNNEWMIPTKAAQNAAGNIEGSVASKMLSDIGATVGYGFLNKKTAKAKRKYVFIGKGGNWGRRYGLPRGIYWHQGPGKLTLMVAVVHKAPTYSKRLKFHDVARSWAAKRMGYFGDKAVAQAISRR